jgi:hypothetical protein
MPRVPLLTGDRSVASVAIQDGLHRRIDDLCRASTTRHKSPRPLCQDWPANRRLPLGGGKSGSPTQRETTSSPLASIALVSAWISIVFDVETASSRGLRRSACQDHHRTLFLPGPIPYVR